MSLARVTRDKGRDLSVLGHHANGVQWLRPEEALCLFEDSLIALHVAVPKEGKEASSADGSSCPVDMSSGGGIGGGGSAPLSVQEAYQIVLGGSTPLVDESVYCVYAHLYRANFVAKVRSTESLLTPASPSATGDGVAAAAASAPIALFDVYHRRNFSRRQAAEGTLPPMYIVAVFGVHHRTPPLAELARLRDACAPTPLRFACTWQHDVLFFKPQWPAQGHVHVPADVDMAAAAAAAAAAEEASGENGVVQRDNDEEVAQINASLTPVGVAATAASNAPPSLPPSLPPSPRPAHSPLSRQHHRCRHRRPLRPQAVSLSAARTRRRRRKRRAKVGAALRPMRQGSKPMEHRSRSRYSYLRSNARPRRLHFKST